MILAGVDPEFFAYLDEQVMQEVIDVITNFDPDEPLTEEEAQFIDQRLQITNQGRADTRRKGVSKKDGRGKYDQKVTRYETTQSMKAEMDRLEFETIEAQRRLQEEAILRQKTLDSMPPQHSS